MIHKCKLKSFLYPYTPTTPPTERKITLKNIEKIKIQNYLTTSFATVSNENEINTILKTMGISKDGENYKLCHYGFSEFIRTKIHLVLQGNQKELAIYNYKKGVYEREYVDVILSKIIKYALDIYIPLWCPSWEDLIIKTLHRDTNIVVNKFNYGRYINLINGIFDLDTYQLLEHSPKYYTTIQIPIEYDTNAKMKYFPKFIDDITCSDEELKKVIQEMLGYCLTSSVQAEKAFFFIGNGCNGKSVLAKIIQLLVGEGNYSNTTLSALSGNFGLASLINSNVNIAAENNSARINSETFKALVSGDTVEVNRKYRDALSLALHTKLVCLFNELPECSDLSRGFYRKVQVIPFKRTFSGKEIDVNMYEKLKTELAGIFTWSIEGLKRLKENNYCFTECGVCNTALEEYKRELNPVATFFEDCCVVDENEQVKRSDIYSNYQTFCIKNSYDVLQCQKFWRALKAHWNDKNYTFKIKKIKGYEYFVGFNIK